MFFASDSGESAWVTQQMDLWTVVGWISLSKRLYTVKTTLRCYPRLCCTLCLSTCHEMLTFYSLQKRSDDDLMRISPPQAYIHTRMRAKTSDFLKVLNRARPDAEKKEMKTIS